MAGASLCPGDDPNMSCHLENGVRVVFSYEQHLMGWCRHLSLSYSDDPLKEVEPDTSAAIAHAFGFKGKEEEKESHYWIEDAWLPTVGSVKAVNIVQKEIP